MNLADPQSLNRYTYVGNQPGLLFDPSGLAPTEDDPAPAGGGGDTDGDWVEFAIVEGEHAFRKWAEGHPTPSGSEGQQGKCLTCNGNPPRVGQDPIAQVHGQIVHVNFLVPTIHGDPRPAPNNSPPCKGNNIGLTFGGTAEIGAGKGISLSAQGSARAGLFTIRTPAALVSVAREQLAELGQDL